ncbi:MAG: hypothetical protein ACT4P3_13480 [Betaproteobacteria bacterium]
MSAHQGPPPAWPAVAAWVLAGGVAALLSFTAAYASSLGEAHVMRIAAAMLALFGVAFLLAARYPESSPVYRYLVWTARRATRSWYKVDDLSGLATRGKAGPAGWLCLGLAVLLALASLWL